MRATISFTRVVTVFLVLVCLISAVQATIIYVPDDYAKIQWAINNASDGDTIIVRDGIYYENLVINKRITLKSENGSANCIIDGNNSGSVIVINADRVTIEGFTIRNSGNYGKGIKIMSNNNVIKNNTILNNLDGIYLTSSSNNNIINNSIALNNINGIELWNSSNNIIINNIVSNNHDGILLWYSSNNIIVNNIIASNNDDGIDFRYSSNNKIYLNNFIGNTIFSYKSTNIWNSTEKITYTYNGVQYTNYLGNYWSDYQGSDANGDGIGDTPYQLDSNNIDYYPLVQPWVHYPILSIQLADSNHGQKAYPVITSTPKLWWKITGFELIYAIIGFLAVAYILRKE